MTLMQRVLQRIRDAVAMVRDGLAGKALRLSADLAFLAIVVVIAAALLGSSLPILDGLNQFTPAWAAAALGTVALAWLGGNRASITRAATLALVTMFLIFAPVLRPSSASEAAPTARPAGQQVAERYVKVMTFNVLWGREPGNDLMEFIRAEQPDIILMQELDRRTADKLDPDLRQRYPHRRFCNDWIGCDGALISRWPVLESRHILRTQSQPASISAVVEIDGRPIRVVGVHMTNPRAPRQQQREIAWLTSHLEDATSRPTIVAGDFNLTPWTFTLARFASRTGLVRHTGIAGTWPANGRFFALFPIDHVLSSKHFSLTRIARGPRLGSDHLPVIATLKLRWSVFRLM